jgi:acetyl esterase/lipase
MEKLISIAVKALKDYPFLLAGVVVLALSLGVKGQPPGDVLIFGLPPVIFALEVGSLVLFSIQLILLSKRGEPSTKIFEFAEVGQVVDEVLKRFEGDIILFNIEGNTLKQKELWSKLTRSEHVKSILLILPPHIVKRLEQNLASDEELKQALVSRDSKVRVLPQTIPNDWNQMAFAFFDFAEGRIGKLQRDCALLFPKTPPFSVRQKLDNASDPLWSYCKFAFSNQQGVVEVCRTVIQDLVSPELVSTAFVIEDLAHFAEGKPTTDFDVIARQHSLSAANRVTFEELVTEPRATPRVSPMPTKLILTTSNGKAELRFRREPDGERKPLLLWLPPWGYHPIWGEVTESVDAALAKHYRVAHLKMRYPAHNYTFTCAEQDVVSAVNAAMDHADECRLSAGGVLISAVSVNAFAAAAAAVKLDKVKALALFMPVVDLFASIDSFRNTNPIDLMFTRKFYHAKEGFRASGISDLKYFERPADVFNLLDLVFRGSRRCSIEFMRENLQELVRREVPIAMYHSRQDTMSRFDDVSALADSLGETSCTFVEIPWFHDVKTGLSRTDPISDAKTNVPESVKGFATWAGLQRRLWGEEEGNSTPEHTNPQDSM